MRTNTTVLTREPFKSSHERITIIEITKTLYHLQDKHKARSFSNCLPTFCHLELANLDVERMCLVEITTVIASNCTIKHNYDHQQ